MRGHRRRGDHRRTAIIGISGAVMLASLAGACLSTSRATEPVAGNGPLPPPLSAGPAAPAPRPPRSFTVVATGGILPSGPVGRPARADGDGNGDGRLAYRRLLGPILPLIRGADLAICHLETPLVPARGPYSGRPVNGAPPRSASALAGLGYDVCSTASDHALDMG